jgi:hypothetical protein
VGVLEEYLRYLCFGDKLWVVCMYLCMYEIYSDNATFFCSVREYQGPILRQTTVCFIGQFLHILRETLSAERSLYSPLKKVKRRNYGFLKRVQILDSLRYIYRKKASYLFLFTVCFMGFRFTYFFINFYLVSLRYSLNIAYIPWYNITFRISLYRIFRRVLGSMCYEKIC